MLKWMLAAGAAALAISAPAMADPKGGKGGGNRDHAEHAGKAQKGGGDRADRGGKGRGGDARGGQSFRVASSDDDKGRGRGGSAKAKSGDDDRGRGRGRDDVRVVRVDDDGKDRGRGWDDGKVRVADIDDDGLRWGPRWDNRGLRLGFADGCPPGLAKKGNGCLPPGQARKIVGTPLAGPLRASMLAGPYRDWYRDDDNFMYRWDDDYIYRVRRDDWLVDAMFPFANRDFYYYPTGVSYPSAFNAYNVPYQYQSFYPDGDERCRYRYGDGAIYCVDPDTQVINGIAALLTGNPLAVGQPLPPVYGAYNVPMAYRPTYYDTADNLYRYNDGYIYRVDPATMLVTAAIAAALT